MTTKEIKDALMEAMTNFVIAEKDGAYAVAYHYMRRLAELFSITFGEYAMLNLWRQVSRLYIDYLES